MYISEVHDYCPVPTGIGRQFISQGRKEAIKSEIAQLIDEEYENLDQFAEEHISAVAASRAEAFLEKLLAGDPEAATRLFGANMGAGRYKLSGYDEGKPWALVINGHIHQTKVVELRRRLVEQYAELLRDERVKDLEATVEGLRLQVVELQGQLDNSRRGY